MLCSFRKSTCQVDRKLVRYASQGMRRKELELCPKDVAWLVYIPVFLEEELRGVGKQAEKAQCCHHSMQEELHGFFFLAPVLCILSY